MGGIGATLIGVAILDSPRVCIGGVRGQLVVYYQGFSLAKVKAHQEWPFLPQEVLLNCLNRGGLLR